MHGLYDLGDQASSHQVIWGPNPHSSEELDLSDLLGPKPFLKIHEDHVFNAIGIFFPTRAKDI